MHTRKIIAGLAIGGIIIFLAAGSVAIAGPPQHNSSGYPGVTLAGEVASKISYQGRLTNASGNPLSGNYNMVFQLWNDASAGGQVGGDITRNGVPVKDGLFNVELDVPQSAFNGQGLWLRIQVNGEWLSPRQELLPTPYALSLKPGASVSSSLPAALYLFSTVDDGLQATTGAANKSGVYGYSINGYGVTGRSDNNRGVQGFGPTGVYGESSADYGQAIQGKGTGPYTEGVLGTASGDHAAAIYGIASGSGADTQGVLGQSTNGDGIEGTTDSPDKSGVYGHSGAGFGVTGASTNKTGVQGFGPTGVYGESSTDYGQAVQGHGTGDHTEGVLGTSDVNVGVYGISGGTVGNAIGVWGQTNGTWGLYTGQNLFVGGTCTGCTVAFLGQNLGDTSFEPGEIVSIAGIVSPLKGGQTPVLSIRRYTETSSDALGVVQTRVVIESEAANALDGGALQTMAMEVPSAAPGTVAPGEYLLVVVQGLAQVKADASQVPIQVGDLISPAISDGHAQKASEQAAAAPALGRALEPLASDTSLIWVLILGQ